MRKRIVAMFLVVGLLVCQNAFISMAEEAGSGGGVAVSGDSAEILATEDVAEDNQKAAGDEEVTEPAPQAEQKKGAENEAPVMEEGTENVLAAYAMESAEPAASPETVSGTYENGMTWEITGDVLTISGNGIVDIAGYDYSGGIEDGINYGETIKEVIINEGATEIGENAFSSYYYRKSSTPGYNGDVGRYWGFRKVSLPSSITKIGDYAFYYCYGLTEINIPEGVTEIGEGAFVHGNLEKVVLPGSIIKIGAGAFNSCGNLREINIPNGVTEIECRTFWECMNLREINIPDGVTRIGDLAFVFCKGLKEINIPDSVIEIGVGAFDGCNELKRVVIPSSVKRIGHSAFSCAYEGRELEEVIFLGDAPEILKKPNGHDPYGSVWEVFEDNTGIAYYPAGNPTWTEEAKMAIGSQLNWIAYEDLQILPEVTDNVYVLGGSYGATIACSGEFKNFVDVYMDDVLVDKENYTVAEGSTILTFASKYLNTLSVGTHKVTLNYTYGSIDTQLEILAYGSGSGSGEAGVTDPGSGAEGSAGADVPATRTAAVSGARITKKSPQTGDENRALPWLLLCFAAVCGGTAVSVRKKKMRE